jgi:DNA-binding response OmpR family regulator
MRGPDLARTLREQRPGLKVLCMSGHPQDAASELGGAGAALPYLQKPFTAEGLARRVRDVLDR